MPAIQDTAQASPSIFNGALPGMGPISPRDEKPVVCTVHPTPPLCRAFRGSFSTACTQLRSYLLLLGEETCLLWGIWYRCTVILNTKLAEYGRSLPFLETSSPWLGRVHTVPHLSLKLNVDGEPLLCIPPEPSYWAEPDPAVASTLPTSPGPRDE
uniref:Uncharacterized protein n=1 Tax=Eutreptiella gymnastica TaxID=73025 RepID=A0A7S1IVG0_9EUGL